MSRTRFPVKTLLVIVGVLTVVATASGNEEYPLLGPGKVVMVAGTQIRCTATDTSATCSKAGGLTATLLRSSGGVSVKMGSTSPTPGGKPRLVHVNGGFVNAGSDNSTIYCHVYVAGTPTLDCSLTGDASGHLPGSHGFDISAASVVVYRFDAAGNLHNVKTYPQP